jgi:hypothetical protein
VNKFGDCLAEEYPVPVAWRAHHEKNMVKGPNGSWRKKRVEICRRAGLGQSTMWKSAWLFCRATARAFSVALALCSDDDVLF